MDELQRDDGFSMKVVAKRTGLSPHVIRVWERRYNAVGPLRSGTGRRLYAEADVERLSLLRAATEAGYSIGQIAHFSDEKLRHLNAGAPNSSTRIGEESVATPFAPFGVPSLSPTPALSAEEILEQCLQSIRELNNSALERALLQGLVALGRNALLENVLVPLMEHVGTGWNQGNLRIAHEHIASAVVRTFLGNLSQNQVGNSAPLLVVSTPAGQLHEIGALIVTAVAASHGWRVSYLGPNLPAEEIAVVALQSGARAVALSVTYPPNDAEVRSELVKLAQALENRVALLVGGRIAESYSQTLNQIGAIRFDDIKSMRQWLNESHR
jgi:DNA-binding transcriptional MerR regulator/methylmalonyl-CoA mutase cobalamin-binding subunit